MKFFRSSLIVFILLSIGLLATGFALTVNSQEEIKLTYQLDFTDKSNLGKNAADNGVNDATVVDNGKISFLKNEVKGKNAVYLTSGGVRQNYLSIPGDVLNHEAVTIAGWFKVSSNIPGWARIIEISNGKNGTDAYTNMGIMPYAPNYFNGLHINTIINNNVIWGHNIRDNMLFQGSIPNIERDTPLEGYILPAYDTWVHYAYVLDGTSFKYYQNGKLLRELSGDFTASQFYSDTAKITLGATFHDATVDFTGGYSDIRVYANSLTESQIISEFDLKYTDFLTTSYDFEDGVKDSVRSYDAALVGNARVEFNEERNSNVLVLDGSNAGNVNETKTSLEIPKTTLHGHNELTISLDVLVDSSCGGYARVFEFSPEGRQALTLGAKWGSATSMLLKYTTQNDVTDQKLALDTEFNNWVNITVTLDGTKACVYVDGRLVQSNDNFIYKNSLFWEAIGCYAFGRTQFWNDVPLKGMMDNIKIYSKALTAKEVLVENKIISIIDDNEAVCSEYEKLNITWDGTSGTIELPTYVSEGVKISYASSNPSVITNEGLVIFPNEPTTVTLTATLTRGDVTMEKTFTFVVNSGGSQNPSIINNPDLDSASFINGSYYEGLMKTNLDYMMSLDKERLLYNYRRIAGLSTNGATSYGAWISTESNGAGQFESHYIIALAKASQTMPNYRYKGESVLERLTYMVTELKKCQDAYAAKDPKNAGYLGGFSVENFTALEEGRNILSDGTTVWVPWYFNHKTLEALLDVYQYAASEELQVMAKEMLVKLANWSYMRMSNITDDVRTRVLQREYGGMGEVLFQIYGVTGNINHYTAAKYFEEKSFLDNTYKNVDLLTGLHSNTTIPKFLAAAAAYEVTNNEYYKTICINGFEMIMKRTYANGSTSIGEFWRSDSVTDTGNDTAETCCSYNMIKLADYLYRWTKDVKYADYIENVYTNHILASMAPDTGLKTYLTNTAFGYYKVYHTPDTAFWCCACTGMESFAKLPNAIYYLTEGNVTVNMFYPTTLKVDENVTLTQSLDFQSQQEALFTIKGNKNFTLSLRKPDWANDVEIYYNGQLLDITEENGYFNIIKDFKDGDTISYKVPFEYRLVNLKGHENTYAIMYGPTLYVCDLGSDQVYDQQPNQLNFGTGYTGNIVDKIVLADETLASSASVSVDQNNQITMIVRTDNQGDLTFRPFNQVFHSRYGMYFKYYDSLDEIKEEYTVNGNEYNASFDNEEAMKDDFDAYSNTGSQFKAEGTDLITPSEGEGKLMLKQPLTTDFVVEFTVSPFASNGQINGGIYLFATNATNAQDGIKAYNIQIEKTSGSSVYSISVFKFNHSFLGSLKSTTVAYDGDSVSLHILVKDDVVYVFVGESKNAALQFTVDRSFITETTTYVGLRSQVCLQRIEDFKLISSEIKIGTAQLEGAIQNAEALDLIKYTPATVAKLEAALEQARLALNAENKTQLLINEANTALRNAISELKLLGNPSQVEALLKLVMAIDERCYTSASYQVLMAVVENINSMNLKVLSQNELDKLSDSLYDAISGLNVVAIDRSLLDAIIAEVEALDGSKYTSSSYNALLEVLAEVKGLDSNASAIEVDAACVKLLQAQIDLVEVEVSVTPDPLDYTLLQTLIANAETLDATLYTEESYAQFMEQVASIKATTNISKQSEINALCVKLFEAQLALVVNQPTTIVPNDSNTSGCAGSVVTSIFTLISLFALVVLLRKKRQHN